MTKNQNTYVKLQIEKDQNSGGLALNVRFDKNAPNFNVEKDTISWSPTLEEIDFVNEAFDMIGRSMGHPSSSRASTPPSPSTPTTTPPQNYPQPEEAPPSEPKAQEIQDPTAQYNPEETGGDDGLLVQANEEDIVEKVLKQKKKGRWRS